MNWDTIEADVNMILDRHYTPGRTQKLRGIVLHHNAGNLSIQDCYNVWQSREASAHYQVDINGRIGQLVNDDDTAWHAGNANPWSIGIEHANNQFGPWTISDATLEAGAHLVAALCKYYGFGRPEWMVNVFPHSYFMATACPGEIAGSQNAAYMSRAQEWYDAMVNDTDAGDAPTGTDQGGTPAPQPTPSGDDVVVTYEGRVGNTWLGEISGFNNVNDNGYIGIPGQGMNAIRVKVNRGSCWYKVHTVGGGWLPAVNGYDRNDSENGYAGDGNLIDGFQMYYTTPDGESYQYAWYRSQTAWRDGYLPVVCDDEDYAGILGEPMDRLQIEVAPSNPF